MSNGFVAQFVLHAQAIAGARTDVRRLEIKRLVEEYEDAIRDNCGNKALEEILSFYDRVKDKVCDEIAANSPNGVPNEMVAFYQNVFEELTSRLLILRR
jgi:hypothetical protein